MIWATTDECARHTGVQGVRTVVSGAPQPVGKSYRFHDSGSLGKELLTPRCPAM